MALTFTAKDAADALENPVLRLHVGARVFEYEGRVLSAPEWFPFWDRYLDIGERFDAIKAAADAGGGINQRALFQLEKDAHALHVDFLRTVFPRHRYHWWTPDPVKQLARSHPRMLLDTFNAFFSRQARATIAPEDPEAASPSTSGSSSPPDSAPSAAPASAGG